jgi:Ca2+-binding RTX toxin-like protein
MFAIAITVAQIGTRLYKAGEFFSERPTDITFSPASPSLTETDAIGTTVATFTATDPTVGDNFTTALTSDSDGMFALDGTDPFKIVTATALTPGTKTIAVRVTDALGGSYQETLAITVDDVNEQPTLITLSKSTVAEKSAIGTAIGTLTTTDPDATEGIAQTFTYTIQTDANGYFQIGGTNSDELQLKLATVPYGTHAVTVRSTDQDGLYRDEAFSIEVTNVNEAPTLLSLSASSTNEGVTKNTLIGTVTVTDPDPSNTFTFELTDSADGKFVLANATTTSVQVRTNWSAKADIIPGTFSIKVKATDQGNLSREETFSITVNNVAETPTDIALSATEFDETVASGTTIATLTAVDPDVADGLATAITFSITAGNDSGYFTMAGGAANGIGGINYTNRELRTAAANIPVGNYTLTILATNGALTYSEQFTITCKFVNDAPTKVEIDTTTFRDDDASGTTIGTITVTDPDLDTLTGDTITLSMTPIGQAVGKFQLVGSEIRTAAANITAGDYLVTVTATDAAGATKSVDFTLTSQLPNNAPNEIVYTGDTVFGETTAIGTPLGTLTLSDPDGDTVSITKVTADPYFAVDTTTNQIKVAEQLTQGSYSVRLEVQDPAGATRTGSVNYYVTPVDAWVPLPGAYIDLDFKSGHYWQSGVGLRPYTDFVEVLRSSNGYAYNLDGSPTSFGFDEARISNAGLLLERARTNVLLNSGAPASQTVSLPAGATKWTLQVWGTGSASIQASNTNGATISPGNGTATQGSPIIFTVTNAGNVDITVNGTLGKFQLENTPYPTSFILTTTATATRSSDFARLIGPALTALQGNDFSVLIETDDIDCFSLNSTTTAEGFQVAPIPLLRASAPNYINNVTLLAVGANTGQVRSILNATTLNATVGSAGSIVTGDIKTGMGFSTTTGRYIVSNDGTVVSDAQNLPAGITTVGLGRAGTSTSTILDRGIIRRLVIWNTKIDSATMKSYTVADAAQTLDVTLSSTTFDDSTANNTTIATISSTGATTPEYTLINNGGGKFTLPTNTNTIKTVGTFDANVTSTYSIVVRVRDSVTGNYLDKRFTISVTRDTTNTAPTNITITGLTVATGASEGTKVGTLSADDAQGDAITWSITSQPTANMFKIGGTSNNELQVGSVPPTVGDKAVTVQASDGSLSSTRTFTINVSDDGGYTWVRVKPDRVNKANKAYMATTTTQLYSTTRQKMSFFMTFRLREMTDTQRWIVNMGGAYVYIVWTLSNRISFQLKRPDPPNVPPKTVVNVSTPSQIGGAAYKGFANDKNIVLNEINTIFFSVDLTQPASSGLRLWLNDLDLTPTGYTFLQGDHFSADRSSAQFLFGGVSTNDIMCDMEVATLFIDIGSPTTDDGFIDWSVKANRDKAAASAIAATPDGSAFLGRKPLFFVRGNAAAYTSGFYAFGDTSKVKMNKVATAPAEITDTVQVPDALPAPGSATGLPASAPSYVPSTWTLGFSDDFKRSNGLINENGTLQYNTYWPNFEMGRQRNNSTTEKQVYLDQGGTPTTGNPNDVILTSIPAGVMEPFEFLDQGVNGKGILRIKSRLWDPAYSSYTKLPYYYSGMINTKWLRSFQYGYFEIRAKLPRAGATTNVANMKSTRGQFPALWLKRDDEGGDGEFDFIEALGTRSTFRPQTLYTGYRMGTKTGGIYWQTQSRHDEDWFGVWHTYGLLWEPPVFGTVTVNNATGVLTWPSNILKNGDPINFVSSGTAPTGLTAGTNTYMWVRDVGTAGAGTFKVAQTKDGPAVASFSGGTGTITATSTPFGRMRYYVDGVCTTDYANSFYSMEYDDDSADPDPDYQQTITAPHYPIDGCDPGSGKKSTTLCEYEKNLLKYANAPMYMIMNLAVGNVSWGENCADRSTDWENMNLDIDYVAVWEPPSTAMSITGTAGDDSETLGTALVGRGGNDTIDGAAGNDWLVGAAGNDSLIGGAGNDALFGADGDDTLDGGTGADTLEGDQGADTYLIDNVDDVILEGGRDGAQDRVVLQNTGVFGKTFDGIEEYELGAAGSFSGKNAVSETIKGSTGNDTITAGNAAPDTFVVTAGTDSIVLEATQEHVVKVLFPNALTSTTTVSTFTVAKHKIDLRGFGHDDINDLTITYPAATTTRITLGSLKIDLPNTATGSATNLTNSNFIFS